MASLALGTVNARTHQSFRHSQKTGDGLCGSCSLHCDFHVRHGPIWARDVREDVKRGRIYIPGDELAQCGVTPDDLQAAHTPEKVRALLALQSERARSYYAHALQALPAIDRRAQLAGLVMGAIYMALLREIENDGFRVLERRVKLTPLRKLWIAWRTQRRETKLAAKYRA